MGLSLTTLAGMTPTQAAQWICYFITFLIDGGRTYSTISVYLVAVRALWTDAGYEHAPTQHPWVQRMMRAVKKKLNKSVPKKAITVTFLRYWAHMNYFPHRVAASVTGVYQRAIWGAMLLAFHALLRASEYTCTGKWDPTVGLTRDDITFVVPDDGQDATPVAMRVRIKTSKTDICHHGAEFTFYTTGGPLCVVTAVWLAYQDGGAVGENPSAPLFVGKNGRTPLSYKEITTNVKYCIARMGLNANEYSSHSFRSGGATALLAAGYDLSYIKIMGRWSSTCYERYLQLDISAIQNMARAMQNVTRERVPFFFDSMIEDAQDTLRI
jgi:hypothetical protein